MQENLPKLFNEIVQFDPDKLQNGGGSGFGLWSKCTFIITIITILFFIRLLFFM